MTSPTPRADLTECILLAAGFLFSCQFVGASELARTRDLVPLQSASQSSGNASEPASNQSEDPGQPPTSAADQSSASTPDKSSASPTDQSSASSPVPSSAAPPDPSSASTIEEPSPSTPDQSTPDQSPTAASDQPPSSTSEQLSPPEETQAPLPEPSADPAQLQSLDTAPGSLPAPKPEQTVAPGVRKPLQGNVEQVGLPGSAQVTGLSGGVGGADWNGTPQQGGMGQYQPNPLQGGAAAQNPMSLNASNDPDAADQELMINWDVWRNNLMQAIQSGTLAKINVPSDVHFVWDQAKQMMVTRYPNGTSAWYAIEVLPDHRIINVRLTQSSRYPTYDQAVLQAINDLQGNNILTYPRGSRRQIVSQEANVRTAGQSQSQNFQFGDVERQRY